MLGARVNSGRTRAWLLISADGEKDAKSKAQNIYQNLRHEGGDDYVVIRADVVKELVKDKKIYHIIVPVDAIDPSKLKAVIQIIEELMDYSIEKQLEVLDHFPSLTYLAQGFVSGEEKTYARDNFILAPDETGRIIKRSPGDNPWG